MAYSIQYLPMAKRDLLNIVDSLLQEYGAEEAAIAFVQEIERRIAHLAEFPYAHPLYQSPMTLTVEMRYLPVKKHVVFYTVLEPAQIVEIRRVLYMRQDIDRQGK